MLNQTNSRWGLKFPYVPFYILQEVLLQLQLIQLIQLIQLLGFFIEILEPFLIPVRGFPFPSFPRLSPYLFRLPRQSWLREAMVHLHSTSCIAPHHTISYEGINQQTTHDILHSTAKPSRCMLDYHPVMSHPRRPC